MKRLTGGVDRKGGESCSPEECMFIGEDWFFPFSSFFFPLSGFTVGLLHLEGNEEKDLSKTRAFWGV